MVVRTYASHLELALPLSNGVGVALPQVENSIPTLAWFENPAFTGYPLAVSTPLLHSYRGSYRGTLPYRDQEKVNPLPGASTLFIPIERIDKYESDCCL
jgi:hypothetical protein